MCLYLTDFDIIDLTAMFSPMTQKPDILTWLIIMSLPACATWSWHRLSNLWFRNPLEIALDIGPWIFVSYHQFLRPRASTYGSSLNICYLPPTCSFFCFPFQTTYSVPIWWSPFLLPAFLWNQSISLCNFYFLPVKAPHMSWLIQATFSYTAKLMQRPFSTSTNFKFCFPYLICLQTEVCCKI